MKKILVVILFLCASTCFAEDRENIVVQIKPMEAIQISCADTGLSLVQKEELGQSGCCSWHGGVCGCSGGSVVCCDNTYSPSCSCKADEKPVETK